MGSSKSTENKCQNGSAQAEDDLLSGISNDKLRELLVDVHQRDPEQMEFLQAVKGVAQSLQPVFEREPKLVDVFRQMCEPERQVVFRVPWLADDGSIRVNRGMRVQFSSAIGPYKGGLRFHPSVNLSIIKFLGFEQIFKNALTTLPMGGGKGGSDFDPKGKSDAEIMKFCQSFMTALYRFIGDTTDIPAGDIGVSTREIGYLYGQYKRITGDYEPTLTGKGLAWGGSNIRPEATGYGCVFFAQEVLADRDDKIEGKRCIVTGSGNVAQYTAEKLMEEGAVVLTLSDSTGYIYEPDGLTKEQLQQVMEIKSRKGKLQEYNSSNNGKYVGDKAKPWELDVEFDLAFPCATQNEVSLDDAKHIVDHGCKYVFEGANMPTMPDAVDYLSEHDIVFVPGKAANAGGVAVSGLEITQQRVGEHWSREEVACKLKDIMKSIYKSIKEACEEYNVSLADGANISAFLKVADAVQAQGAV